MVRPISISIPSGKKQTVVVKDGTQRTIELSSKNEFLHQLFTLLLCRCLPLIPLGASREERYVFFFLLHAGMAGQEGCCTKVVSL